jgi:hypothetical protein
MRELASALNAFVSEIEIHRRILGDKFARACHDRGYTVRWHPITVETAAAGMLRSHEQQRELAINFDR